MISVDQFRKELDELKGKLTFCAIADDGSSRTGIETDDVSIEQWMHYFGPLSPKEFVRKTDLSGNLKTALEISYSSYDGKNYADIYSRITTTDGLLMGSSSYKIYEAKDDYPKTIHNSGFYLSSNYHGKNIAKSLYEKRADLGFAIGAKQLSLAAMNIGSYAWAKFGFIPNKASWDGIVEDINKAITESDTGATLKFRGKDYEITPDELTAIRAITSSSYENAYIAFPQLTEFNREIGTYDDHTLTVGKALLIGNVWRGTLPLDRNHPSYKRFERYIGSAKDQELQVA